VHAFIMHIHEANATINETGSIDRWADLEQQREKQPCKLDRSGADFKEY
jgi:hypothetical protein